MQRRSFIALFGTGLAGLAGCLGTGPAGPAVTGTPLPETDSGPTPTPVTDGTPTDWPQERPPPSATPRPDPTTLALGEPFDGPDGWSLTLSNARVRRIALRAGVHLDPVAVPGGQYVIVDLRADRTGTRSETERSLPDPGGFFATLDGAFSWRDGGFWADQAGLPTGGEATLAVPVRTAGSDRAAVRWFAAAAPVEWTLSDAHRSAIASAPAFEIREFAVPDAIERGRSFEVSLTVANVGDRDGAFLAELGANTISDTPEFRLDVPAGGAVAHTESLDPHYPEGAEELDIVLNWGVDRLVRQVTVN